MTQTTKAALQGTGVIKDKDGNIKSEFKFTNEVKPNGTNAHNDSTQRSR